MRSRGVDLARRIAFVHHKGGTGKTTSCLSIAGYLVKAKKRVLVVDFDPQANATSGLGIDKDALEASMYEVLVGERKLREVILETESGIHLAPATLDLVGAGPIFYKRRRGEVLKEALGDVEQFYDYILVDAPPGVGQFMINAVVAADQTIVTLDPGIFALEGVGSLTTLLEDVREYLKVKVEPAFAILTRCSKPPKQRKKKPTTRHKRRPEPEGVTDPVREIQERAKEMFKKVFTVPYSVEMFEAQAKGVPISHHAPRCGAARAYKKIADEVLRYG